MFCWHPIARFIAIPNRNIQIKKSKEKYLRANSNRQLANTEILCYYLLFELENEMKNIYYSIVLLYIYGEYSSWRCACQWMDGCACVCVCIDRSWTKPKTKTFIFFSLFMFENFTIYTLKSKNLLLALHRIVGLCTSTSHRLIGIQKLFTFFLFFYFYFEKFTFHNILKKRASCRRMIFQWFFFLAPFPHCCCLWMCVCGALHRKIYFFFISRAVRHLL